MSKEIEQYIKRIYNDDELGVLYIITRGRINEIYFKRNSEQKSGKLHLYNRLKKELLEKYDVQYAVINPNIIISTEQIIMAIDRVHKIFEDRINITQDPSIEFLLYLTGTRQIKKALEIGGIPPNFGGDTAIEVLFGSRSVLTSAFNHLYESTPDIRRDFTLEPFDNPIGTQIISFKAATIMRIHDISIEELNTILSAYSSDELKGSDKRADFELIYELSDSKGSVINEKISQDNGQSAGELFGLIKDYGISAFIRALMDSLYRSMTELMIDNFKKQDRGSSA